MKAICFSVVAALAAMTTEAGLSVEVTSVEQMPNRTVEVGYALSGGPAVVTLSVETNGPNGWVRLDGRHCSRTAGDVFRKVAKTAGSFSWTPDDSGIDRAIAAGELKVTLTAWAMCDTPDYMVVSLARNEAAAERIRYYTCTNEFPGGLLENFEYRTTKLVMKRVRARAIPWTMGSVAALEPVRATNEGAHQAILDHDYYLGVFPLTTSQACALRGGFTSFGFTVDRAMRIADKLFYTGGNPMRGSNWPQAPASGSMLANLRQMTAGEIDNWDLPSEAEWEYAAKAGQISGFWGNGAPYAFTDATYKQDDTLPGRYRYNQETDWWTKWQDYTDGGAYGKSTDQPVGNGCPVAGSYAPNAWGFYDMNGGIWERCVDYYQDDITKLGGAVNISLDDDSKCADGTQAAQEGRIRVSRGGCYKDPASNCRASCRSYVSQSYAGDSSENAGRICCRAGL